MNRILLLLAATLLVSCTSPSPPPAEQLPIEGSIGIIPQPRSVAPRGGAFVLDGNTVVCANTEAEIHAAEMLAASLEPVLKFRPPIVGGEPPPRSIRFVGAESQPADPKLDSAYRLHVEPDRVEITGSGRGMFYGVQSLLQLIKPDVSVPVRLPAVDIDDKPRFEYRGMHLDVVRHFMSVDFVKRYIDLLARYKFNYFHWHLTDDQGWRIEIKKYPRLTEVGSKRDRSALSKSDEPLVLDHTPVSGFYTQDEIRDIVGYASARYVTIIPEIDMPGHASAVLAAYPQYGCLGERHPYKVQVAWGAFPDLMCPSDETFGFVEDVLGEVIEMFPDSPYIHIGGDEVKHFDQWDASPIIRQLKAAESLNSNNEVVAYFVRRVNAFLASHGRRALGWDDILAGGDVPDVGIMVWQAPEQGARAAMLGHTVIMAPGDTTYFDYAADEADAAHAAYTKSHPLEQVYAFDPMPPKMPPAALRNIIGGEGCLWTEFIRTEADAEYMLMPRAIALSEALWSERDRMGFANFTSRLRTELTRLSRAGVNYSIPKPVGLVSTDLKPGETARIVLDPPTLDSKIFFTLDGTDPTPASELYSGPFPRQVPFGGFRLRTLVVEPDGRRSTIFEAKYGVPATTAETLLPGVPAKRGSQPVNNRVEIVEQAPVTAPARKPKLSSQTPPPKPAEDHPHKPDGQP